MATVVEKTRPDGSKYWVLKTEGRHQVEFTEVTEAYAEEYVEGEYSCTRLFDCNWNERLKFLDDLVGTAEKDPDGSLKRFLPELHPDIADMWCVAAKLVRGVGRPDIDRTTGLPRFLAETTPPPGMVNDHPDNPSPTDPAYGKARYLTTWRKLPYPLKTDAEISGGTELDRYVQRLPTYAAETLPVGANAFKWVTAPQDPIPAVLNRTFFTRELTYVWHRVPEVPDAFIDNCVGKVNSAVFDSYAIGTLLCLPPEVYLDPSDQLWRITYKFWFRSQGWNKYYRPTAVPPAFQDFSVDGTASLADGNRLHDQADFAQLFTLEPDA